VIDQSDQRGQLCGQILADLGADVILVEPPGGFAGAGSGSVLQEYNGSELFAPFLGFQSQQSGQSRSI
jgi:crotonobetainyl-CoA:carnitine CoA-transferase CaiB-like acyl-CoA transferase